MHSQDTKSSPSPTNDHCTSTISGDTQQTFLREPQVTDCVKWYQILRCLKMVWGMGLVRLQVLLIGKQKEGLRKWKDYAPESITQAYKNVRTKFDGNIPIKLSSLYVCLELSYFNPINNWPTERNPNPCRHQDTYMRSACSLTSPIPQTIFETSKYLVPLYAIRHLRLSEKRLLSVTRDGAGTMVISWRWGNFSIL
ncbi:hypothetical protein CEXT_390051 [Caerostris extrusa]|uniref:Uncharacterized protein n=1 Tax=Caerostris extrusa TaxID=172846 RepID=A0AAV4MZD8_CAEEX|nr:hypothetical protein CEXT_390051 [Caerostris extrusa]